jgi:hypothetical protein
LTVCPSAKVTGVPAWFSSLVSTRMSEDERRGATWTLSITGLSETRSETAS